LALVNLGDWLEYEEHRTLRIHQLHVIVHAGANEMGLINLTEQRAIECQRAM